LRTQQALTCGKAAHLVQQARRMLLHFVRLFGLGLVLVCAVGRQDFGLMREALAETASKAERGFELRIENGRVQLAERVLRVQRGDRVRLRWTTDDVITIHLHGYDIEARATPDAPVDMTFEARATGRFPITSHPSHRGPHTGGKSSSHAGAENVLLYLEVHPR